MKHTTNQLIAPANGPDSEVLASGSTDEGLRELQNASKVPITEQEVGQYKEQDRYLPIANVARIMKNAVPPTAKVAKDAKECVQECVSEFISFITSEAAERCQLEKRKTIGGEDIIAAMDTLGFPEYVVTLRIYLARLREQQASLSSTAASGPAGSGDIDAKPSRADGVENDTGDQDIVD